MNHSPPTRSPLGQLYLAARTGDCEGAKAALDAGANLHEPLDHDEDTALHIAVRGGHADLVSMLLLRGATHQSNESDRLPISVAIESDDPKRGMAMLELLLTHDPGLARLPNRHQETPLHTAMSKGSGAVIQRILDENPLLEAGNEHGQTPLMAGGCHNDNPKNLRLLLEKGASASAVDHFGDTALHTAAEHGAIEIMATLLDAGADARAANRGGETPLHCLGRGMLTSPKMALNAAESVRLLAKHGADLNAKAATNGYGPAHYAAMEDSPAQLTALCDLGANLEATSLERYTPLHVAAANGSFRCLRVLLERGADTGALDNAGNTPEVLASLAGHDDIAGAIREWTHARALECAVIGGAGTNKPRL